MLYTHNERRRMNHNTSLKKYVSHTLFLKGVEASMVCETDRRRETRQIAFLTHNFSWQ